MQVQAVKTRLKSRMQNKYCMFDRIAGKASMTKSVLQATEPTAQGKEWKQSFVYGCNRIKSNVSESR